MKTMIVELYSSGDKVQEIKDVTKVNVWDKGYITVNYKDGDVTRIVETNLPFIYYDGVKDE